MCGFRQHISPPRSCGSQPKISKTTPCKVAGSRRHGCALGKYLTRRANQRHSFIIAQSVKRTLGRAMAATAVNVKLILPPRQSRGGLPVMLGLGKCPRLKGQGRKDKAERKSPRHPLVSSAVHPAYADIFRSVQPIARNVATINRRAPLTAWRPIPVVNRPSSARCAKTYCNAT